MYLLLSMWLVKCNNRLAALICFWGCWCCCCCINIVVIDDAVDVTVVVLVFVICFIVSMRFLFWMCIVNVCMCVVRLFSWFSISVYVFGLLLLFILSVKTFGPNFFANGWRKWYIMIYMVCSYVYVYESEHACTWYPSSIGNFQYPCSEIWGEYLMVFITHLHCNL